MVLAIDFYCDLCFLKKIILWTLGDFLEKKKFEGLQFSSCHFGGLHFLFFRVKGALLLWILTILFTILKFQNFQFFFLSFCGFSKNNCVKFCRGGERGVFAFLLVNFKSFLFSYFEVSKFLIFLLIILGVLIFFLVWGARGGGGGGGGFALVEFESFCFTILKFWSFQFFFLSFCGS